MTEPISYPKTHRPATEHGIAGKRCFGGPKLTSLTGAGNPATTFAQWRGFPLGAEGPVRRSGLVQFEEPTLSVRCSPFMSSRADMYRQKAADAKKRAAQAKNLSVKKAFEEVARGWLVLAEQMQWIDRQRSTACNVSNPDNPPRLPGGLQRDESLDDE
jgi:hypothetical protein